MNAELNLVEQKIVANIRKNREIPFSAPLAIVHSNLQNPGRS